MLNGQTNFTENASVKGIAIDGSKDGGFTFADFNNDGYLDLMVNTNVNDVNHRSRLYYNDGPPNFTFTDVTTTKARGLIASGLSGSSVMERCGVAGDLNNDGNIDFIRNASTRLEVYLNNGLDSTYSFGLGANQDPNFFLWTASSSSNNPPNGIPNGMNTEGIGLLDYDNDGDLDIMIENHNWGIDIYENNLIPSGTFSLSHVTPGTSTVLGLDQNAVDGDYASVTDFDDDGYIDIVARKRNMEDFWRNNGDNTFSAVSWVDEQADNSDKGAVSLYDFDNDGDYELVWTNSDTNQIWQQSGVGSGIFIGTNEPEVSSAVILPTSGVDGLACGDIDNDGDVDLFFCNDSGSSFLFLNTTTPGDTVLNFTRNNCSINVNGDAEGAAFIDYDNDGDLDLYINVNGGDNQLWTNRLNTNDRRNHLYVRVFENLDNTIPDRDALGANVLLKDCAGNVVSGIREVNGGNGHGTQDPAFVHFGLPDGDNQEYIVEIHYPYLNGSRKISSYRVNPSTLGSYHLLEITPQFILDNPVAVDDDGGNIHLGVVDTFHVLSNDYDIESDYFTILSITNPSTLGTSMIIASDTSIQYTAGMVAGLDTVHYEICQTDCITLCDQAMLIINIVPAENCSNGIDDDLDGYADCFDDDCPCYAPIVCDGRLYQTINVGGDFWLYGIETNPVTLSPIMNLTAAGIIGDINNAYYNSTDGFIYFMNTSPPYRLYRVNAANGLEYVGDITGFPGSTINAAGNDNAGNYYFRAPSDGDFYLLDETTLSVSLVCNFPGSAWPETNIGDFAYNPINDKFYGTREQTDMLIEIDLNTCTQDTITLSETITGALGAFFISADGTGYGYGNATGSLLEIDLSTGAVALIGTGTTTSNTDGCSCSTVLLTKTASADSVCLSETLTYTFEIFNQSGAALTNLIFSDTLPSGLSFASNPYNINGITFSGSTTTNGATAIALNVASVSDGSSNSFQIDVQIAPSSPFGTYSNQAILSGLPPFLPYAIYSDDPNSLPVLDPTSFELRSCAEICGNGLDDDGDGLNDCDDPDCISSPTILLSLNTACVNETIVISSSDMGTGSTYTWSFGANATPATASGIGPHNVSYTTCGAKTVSLNHTKNGCSIAVDSILNITDNTNPVWNTDPQDLIMECQSSANYADSIALWLANDAYGAASDNCSHFKITHNYSGLTPDCGSTASTTVQFIAMDSCGNTAIRNAQIQILDTNAPVITPVDDLTIDCETIPSAMTPSIADSCDATPALTYREVLIQHPNADWRSNVSCSILYEISSGIYDDKGTVATGDDEMSFVLTVIGKNTGTNWQTNIGGSPVSGAYYESKLIATFLSGGPTANFTISDNVDGGCTSTVSIDGTTF